MPWNLEGISGASELVYCLWIIRDSLLTEEQKRNFCHRINKQLFHVEFPRKTWPQPWSHFLWAQASKNGGFMGLNFLYMNLGWSEIGGRRCKNEQLPEANTHFLVPCFYHRSTVSPWTSMKRPLGLSSCCHSEPITFCLIWRRVWDGGANLRLKWYNFPLHILAWVCQRLSLIHTLCPRNPNEMVSAMPGTCGGANGKEGIGSLEEMSSEWLLGPAVLERIGLSHRPPLHDSSSGCCTVLSSYLYARMTSWKNPAALIHPETHGICITTLFLLLIFFFNNIWKCHWQPLSWPWLSITSELVVTQSDGHAQTERGLQSKVLSRKRTFWLTCIQD